MTKLSKTELNRKRLLNQGIKLLSANGYHGIGLKDILGAVKIPKGSFYHYFESKEDFGTQVIDYYTELTEQRISAAFADTTVPGLSALQQFFDDIIQMHREDEYKHGCLAGNLGAEVSVSSESCRLAVAHSMDVTRDAFERVIARGQKDGSIRGDIPPKVLADILFNHFEGAMLRMKVEKSGEPLDQLRNVVLTKFFAAG